MADESGKAPSYKATCNVCGGIVGAAVITADHTADTAKYVASWIRAGFRLDTVTVQEIREGAWCKCVRRRQKRRTKAREGPDKPATLCGLAEAG
jgi:hypothetical protein